ncbi:Fungalysin metallopeptidase-domain-containing protein [Melanogaster broomeanus]|nr:Fungalysin metallopeptidase-domain-containing protein [Melanogaster broomeanus]
MRGLTTVTLALAGLAAHALAHSTPPPISPSSPQRRKSLGFGPVLPHARFHSINSVAGFAPLNVDNDPYAIARDFLSQYHDSKSGRGYATGVTHIYARQILGSIEVADAHVNLNIKDGRVLSFRRPLLAFLASALPDNHPELTSVIDNADELVSNIAITTETHLLGDHMELGMSLNNVPGTIGEVKARVVLGPSSPPRTFEVEMEYNWYEATVTTSLPHRIMSVVDWASDSPMPLPAATKGDAEAYTPVPQKPQLPEVSKASYLVFPWGVNDPGWHSLPVSWDPSDFWRTTNTTWGNNVFAHENWDGKNAWMHNKRPEGSVGASTDVPAVKFAYPYAPVPADTEDESIAQAQEHIDATVTQLFYTSNMAHDLFYRYGFTEVAGNFQQYNFGKGGAEGDAVITNAQDGSGFNNANFMTPPDGQNGRCRMYLWNTDSPYPDGDFEAGIVIHELAHGLSTRLTGGPKNSGCLGWGESGGMGEGWGDFIATSVRSTSTYSDYAMGAWASNQEGGIRNYPYSLDMSINPSTYKTLDKPGYWGVHAIGEVWAQMLWVVQQRFIAKHGFSETLFPPVLDLDGNLPPNDFYRPQTYNPLTSQPNPLVPKHGNTLLLQLVLDGMKLQPCSPSFFDARDAIIQADEILTGGENFCDLWEGFADRGLGADATYRGEHAMGWRCQEGWLRSRSQVRIRFSCSELSQNRRPSRRLVTPTRIAALCHGAGSRNASGSGYPVYLGDCPWGYY